MKPSTICIPLAAAFVAAPAVFAQDKPQTQAQTETRDSYGDQMMTPQERERIRTEHHALMKQRAKERGITMRRHGARQIAVGA